MTTTTSITTATSSTQPTSQPARWTLDASHSTIAFKVRHLMISNVNGSFKKVTGNVVYDPKRPEGVKVSASIEVSSISTNEEKRDAHLLSADFFDAEKYPTIEFTSRRFDHRGDGGELTGDLVIHGVTREVTLNIEEITEERVDPWGARRIGVTAATKIRRSDFGITWNAALEAGGVVVGDTISIQIEAELVKQS